MGRRRRPFEVWDDLPLPEQVAVMPRADAAHVPCPYCGQVLEPPPRRARVCEHCGEHFRVWRCAKGVQRVLTVDAQFHMEMYRIDVYPPFVGMTATIGEEGERELDESLERMREEKRQALRVKYDRDG